MPLSVAGRGASVGPRSPRHPGATGSALSWVAMHGDDIVAIAVRDAMDGLPAEIARRVDNVAVEIADDEPSHPGILGLYQGIPLTERRSYAFALPDRITIFRRTLERLYGHDPALLRERTMHVVRHEFAHHFGISDERLHEIGRY